MNENEKNRNPLTREMIRIVPCPSCGARDGGYCVSSEGHERLRSHYPRMRAAQRHLTAVQPKPYGLQEWLRLSLVMAVLVGFGVAYAFVIVALVERWIGGA